MAAYQRPLHPDHFTFPDPARARPDGLLAMGGDLKPRRLFEAYYRGIFPWYDVDMPILWHCPDPRGVLLLDQLHVPRRLERDLTKFVYTINRDFPAVITSCATIHEENHGGTWILPEMMRAYVTLHEEGIAHSVEIWRDEGLVGGIYGVAMGGNFCCRVKVPPRHQRLEGRPCPSRTPPGESGLRGPRCPTSHTPPGDLRRKSHATPSLPPVA